MALNASGQISMAGSTVGQSIELELGGNGTTTISLNDTNARTLAGIASGSISLADFYGKSTGPTIGGYYAGNYYTPSVPVFLKNIVTRINACGSLVGSETSVGTARYFPGGAIIGTNGVFYGGAGVFLTYYNKITRVNGCGALVGSETTAGTLRGGLAGSKVGSLGVYYGGSYTGPTNTATRINACGALVGSETLVGTVVDSPAGAYVGSNAVFYGGCEACYTINSSKVTRINACGAIVGSEGHVGAIRRFSHAGSTVGANGLYYAGSGQCIANNICLGSNNKITRINACGAMVGTETTAGTSRNSLGGARIGSNGVFYGGSCCSSIMRNTTTRINACGALVGSETLVGSNRYGLAGTG